MSTPCIRQRLCCRSCDQRMPLYLADATESASLWECSRCGTTCAGILSPEVGQARVEQVRLADDNFATGSGPPVSRYMYELLERTQHLRQRNNANRRRATRLRQMLTAPVLPLDERMVAAAVPVNALIH